MRTDGLSDFQLATILLCVERKLAYFTHLTGRMHQTHFPLDDPLRVEAEKAREAVEGLAVKLRGVAESRGIDPCVGAWTVWREGKRGRTRTRGR